MDRSKDSVAYVEQRLENPEISSAVVEEKTSPENSEYDSVDSYSDEEGPPVIKARSKASGLDSHSETEVGSVILEREEGDGQESVPSKKVDDDEDKKNPQYIPKRGTFYEHDDRTADDVESQEATDADKNEKDPKKKVWQDKKEKWTHDRFNDQEQAPKSRSELVAIYGYDIRNEDGPPRARRRRRYGRGPNKYTRNWEDEDAYGKPPAPRPQRPTKKQPGPKKNAIPEEFPPLNSSGRNNRSRNKSRSSDSNHEDGGGQQGFKENEDNELQNKAFQKMETRKETGKNVEQQQAKQATVSNQEYNQSNQNQNRSNQSSRGGADRVAGAKKEIKDSDYRGFTTKTRQQRGVRSEQQKVLPPRNFKNESGNFIQSQNFTNKNNNQEQMPEIEKEMGHLNIKDGVYKGGKQNNAGNNQNRQGSVPPRLQQSEQQKGSKRYSSMRQRSLPETGTPPANYSFYPTDYNSVVPPPATQQPILPNPLPALVAPQVPVTAAPPPLLQAPFPPPTAFAPPPPPQAYLQAPPPAFMAPPPAQPQIVSYVTQAQPAFVQGYQGQFNAVTQPAELYQPQGGITYYSTDQQVVQRPVPQKRPKAAIPIVAPTDFKEQRQIEYGRSQFGEGTSNPSDTQSDAQE